MVDKRYEIAEKEETWGRIVEDEVASREGEEQDSRSQLVR